MSPIDFPQVTHVIAKDQPEYAPLPVHVDSSDPATPMTACFQLSQEEIDEIVRTGKLSSAINIRKSVSASNADNQKSI